MSYPVPAYDVERLRTRRTYKILDTKPEERFDDLTLLQDELTVRDADEHSAAQGDVGLEELISHLHDAVSNLQAVRGEQKKKP